MPSKIVLAITGASGSIYAQRMILALQSLRDQYDEVAVVLSSAASEVWLHETGTNFTCPEYFKEYAPNNFYAPFASGSAGYDCMIIAPCSMGTLSRIACGTSNDLITRAADVMLKERRRLILAIRETPLNLIHIENMRTLTLAGGIICPATPSFYSKPTTIEQVVDTVIYRILSLAGFKTNHYQWQNDLNSEM